eukprot:710569-Pleurochrysis_carterae.AAC.1
MQTAARPRAIGMLRGLRYSGIAAVLTARTGYSHTMSSDISDRYTTIKRQWAPASRRAALSSGFRRPEGRSDHFILKFALAMTRTVISSDDVLPASAG